MLKTILLKAREKISFQNFKEFNFKKHFKLFSFFLILIIVGLVLPQGFVHADVVSWVMDRTIFPVLYIVFANLVGLGFVITWIGAYTLNATLNPAIMNQVFTNPAIYQGWTLIRDICNLLFLLIMLLVAFGTIVQSSKYNIKNSLLKLILAIFLINFSNVIAGAIIDFGNILMYGILGWMCAIPDSCFSDYMGGLMKVAWNFFDQYNLLKLLTLDGINSTQVIGAAVAMVYLFMYGFILLALAAFLMVRTAGLALLLILAPFAYFGEVMPGMEKI
ncbi:hypothetical protein KJ633_07510, partial [bacterium]|nr:hypothetical protein [bacterium]